MPNWTSNIIRAAGAEAAIDDFIRKTSGPDGPFDFNAVIPMPAILRHTGAGSRIFDGEGHRSWYVVDPDLRYGDPGYEDNQRPFTPEERAELEALGHDNWYDWSLDAWGTKWNACRAEIEKIPADLTIAQVRFDTAWSAPLPIFERLPLLFPRLAFTFSWSDEDDRSNVHTLTVPVGSCVAS